MKTGITPLFAQIRYITYPVYFCIGFYIIFSVIGATFNITLWSQSLRTACGIFLFFGFMVGFDIASKRNEKFRR